MAVFFLYSTSAYVRTPLPLQKVISHSDQDLASGELELDFLM
jgi:hypothetical protein